MIKKMSIKNSLLFLVVATTLLLSTGCGVSFSIGGKEEEKPSEAKIATSAQEEMESGIELIWEIPATPVAQYNIYFGNSADSLVLYKSVSIAELERFRHDSFGPVFRYVATGLEKKCDIFVAIEAENRAGKSPRTSAKKLSCQ